MSTTNISRDGAIAVFALVTLTLAGCGESAPPPAAPSVRAEFEEIAQRLFSTPRGEFYRHASTDAREALKTESDINAAMSIRFQIVEALLREDRTQEAVEEIERAFVELRPYPHVLEEQALPHRMRGRAYLRLAEVQNCIGRHNEDCCVFPLQGGGVHLDKKPAEQAAASFRECLRVEPGDLGARWLLNIAHMALGTHPEGVPAEHRIPEVGPNSADFPRFREIASSCGFTRLNHAGGVIADDFDGDGLLDLMLSSMCPDVPLALFRNQGDGTFADVAAGSGLDEQLGALNLFPTDYDGDGDLDVFVTRGAWLFEEGRIRNSLLRNEGNGKFTDVTAAAGLVEPKCPTQAAAWFDYDNDGDLDVFVGNESRVEPVAQGAYGYADYPSNLFRNEGNGRFVDVAKAAGVTNDRYAKGVTAGDYDGDGWMDLYISNIGKNRLYRNNRDGTFTDMAEDLKLTEPSKRSFAPWFFDVDNDGDLDLFVCAYDAEIEDVAAWHLGKPFRGKPPRLYRNRGDGTFEDMTRTFELWRPMAPMGANFGDLDNDGWLDVYLSTGNPSYEALMPNVMLRNVGGRHFKDVTVSGGFGNLQKGHGVAFADLDNDGDQDVFNEIGGFYQGDVFFNKLYENPGFGHRFLTLRLVGTQSNRLGYGARIKVVVATPDGQREIHRAVGSLSSFGGSPTRQEIGLGDATAIRSVEVWWPKSGLRQTFSKLELDAFYEIVEGQDDPKRVHPKRLDLGHQH